MTPKQRKGTRIQAKQEGNNLEAQIEHIDEYSPYPPAEFLQELQKIDPKLVERVMTMAEQEQQHRHAIVSQQIEEVKRVNTAKISFDQRNLDLMSRGQWFGLALSFSLVVLAGGAIYAKESWVAGTAIAAILGILVVYVLRKEPKKTPVKDVNQES